MLLRPCRRRSSCGFTLTELAIVLGVIGLLLGAIWGAASLVYANNRTARATEQVLQIVANFKGVYGTHPVDTGVVALPGTDITGMAVSNNLLPSDILPSGITCSGIASTTCSVQPIGPWPGSTILIYGWQTNNGILIQYSNLTRSACDNFANGTTSGNGGLIYYNINGNASAIGPGVSLTTAQINTFCSLDTGNYVQVMYSMGS